MARRSWFARNKHLYPADWKAIATRAKDAVGWVCPGCDAPHGKPPHVLTVHHLNHDPSDCRDENLLACCQRCHLRLGPHVYTKDRAIEILRRRHANQDVLQLALGL